MNLTLKRHTFTAESTIGSLYIDGVFFCYVLEDVVREPDASKVQGKTAIPYGTYSVRLSLSNRFKRIMPEILRVPNFSGIRIHTGNTHLHTDGCLLVGYSKAVNRVFNSRQAYADLTTRMRVAEQQKKAMTITIVKV